MGQSAPGRLPTTGVTADANPSPRGIAAGIARPRAVPSASAAGSSAVAPRALGAAHGSAAVRRKKSELVDELARLFTDAAGGKLDDPQLAERVSAWLPANLRDEVHPTEYR